MKKTIAFILLLAFVAGCKNTGKDEPAVAREFKVKTAVVQSFHDELSLSYSGTVEASQVIPLTFRTAGTVEKIYVEVGDPVTPLTSFQEGTVLMKMANMERLLFKGTVDEIDVGKMREGMEAEIKVGALPNDTVRGTLRKIWLKAEKKENATVFPIEILIPGAKNSVLRAGYSATATIIVRAKENILTLPERLVLFENGKKFVEVMNGETVEKKEVQTGLSDGLNIEIAQGLSENDSVVERPPREIK